MAEPCLIRDLSRISGRHLARTCTHGAQTPRAIAPCHGDVCRRVPHPARPWLPAFAGWGLADPDGLARALGDDPAYGRPLGFRDGVIGVALLTLAWTRTACRSHRRRSVRCGAPGTAEPAGRVRRGAVCGLGCGGAGGDHGVRADGRSACPRRKLNNCAILRSLGCVPAADAGSIKQDASAPTSSSGPPSTDVSPLTDTLRPKDLVLLPLFYFVSAELGVRLSVMPEGWRSCGRRTACSSPTSSASAREASSHSVSSPSWPS